MTTLSLNSIRHQADLAPDTPLLWALCDAVTLTGIRYGWGIADCGACTVDVSGVTMRPCSVPIAGLEGDSMITIAGLSPDGRHPVQLAWIADDMPQCGYCQSGQIMATAAFLKADAMPTDANICRCGTYEGLRRAIDRAAASMKA